jgi:hypothetical protein
MSDGGAAPAGLSDRRDASVGRRSAIRRGIGPSELTWLIGLGIAAVYIVVFVLQLPRNIGQLGWVSDFASCFILPETLVKSGTGGHTLLSTTGAYLPLWFGLLTAKLPLHRQLWEIGPTLLLLASALTIGWSVAQVACRRAAVLAMLIVLVASPWALAFFMAPAHNTVYPATALLGAYLIWLTRAPRRRRVINLAVPVFAAVVLGACVASDALFIVTGVIPFAITAIAFGLQRDRHSRLLAVSALATVVGAIPIALLIAAIMRSQGYLTLPPPAKLASPSMLPGHARLLFVGLEHLFNGYLGHASSAMFGGLTPAASGPLHGELGVACDIVFVAALIALLALGGGTMVSFVRSRWRAGAHATPAQLARASHVIYWFSSAVVICAAFEFSTRAMDRYEAYYATVVFSVAAVVPLLMRRGSVARWLIPAGASILFAGSLVGLTSHYLDTVYDPPISRYGSDVARVAREHGVTAGYAGYWDASSLTWSSHERVTVRPLIQCANPAGAGICPFFLNRVPSWYVPRKRRSFLLVDPDSLYVVALPEGLGAPSASYAIGPMRMYIYPYDIASRLGPATD